MLQWQAPRSPTYQPADPPTRRPTNLSTDQAANQSQTSAAQAAASSCDVAVCNSRFLLLRLRWSRSRTPTSGQPNNTPTPHHANAPIHHPAKPLTNPKRPPHKPLYRNTMQRPCYRRYLLSRWWSQWPRSRTPQHAGPSTRRQASANPPTSRHTKRTNVPTAQAATSSGDVTALHQALVVIAVADAGVVVAVADRIRAGRLQ